MINKMKKADFIKELDLIKSDKNIKASKEFQVEFDKQLGFKKWDKLIPEENFGRDSEDYYRWSLVLGIEGDEDRSEMICYNQIWYDEEEGN